MEFVTDKVAKQIEAATFGKCQGKFVFICGSATLDMRNSGGWSSCQLFMQFI